uniref:Uncharacterized protein n=1 Tax=Setaria italica TaxID=4555 RepID=K3XU81_SETIT
MLYKTSFTLCVYIFKQMTPTICSIYLVEYTAKLWTRVVCTRNKKTAYF